MELPIGLLRFLSPLEDSPGAAIIGFVVDGIKKKLEDLETGRSKVIEAGHVLVLG